MSVASGQAIDAVHAAALARAQVRARVARRVISVPTELELQSLQIAIAFGNLAPSLFVGGV